MVNEELLQEYIGLIKNTSKFKKSNSEEEYVKEVDCVQLNTLFSNQFSTETKKGYSESTVIMTAFILGKIIDRITFDRMERVQMENGVIMVWIKHKRFLDSIKGIDLTLRSFRNYIGYLTKLGILGHEVRGLDTMPKHYYYITNEGLKLLSINALGEYLRVVENVGGISNEKSVSKRGK